MMKKFLFVVLAAILAMTSCSAQSNLLKDLPTGNGVSKVVLGPAMMKLASQYAGSASHQYKGLFKEIKSIEVYTCENKKISAQAINIFAQAMKGAKIEQVVMSEDDDDVSNIYTIVNPETNEPEGMIIYSYDKNDGELDIVIMKGKINLEKIAEIAGDAR